MVESLEVGGVTVVLTSKKIKNVHLRVCPPDGNVLVSAPVAMPKEELALILEEKLDWIKKQKKRIAEQPRVVSKVFEEGEHHYFQGQRYQLRVIVNWQCEKIEQGYEYFILFVKPETSLEKKQKLLNEWYRQQLKQSIPLWIKKYEALIGVRVETFGIKRMKTRWGSCNPSARRIWLGLDLAKVPGSCLEYVVLHEMVHLLERHHNTRFTDFMDRFMPDWRLREEELNKSACF